MGKRGWMDRLLKTSFMDALMVCHTNEESDGSLKRQCQVTEAAADAGQAQTPRVQADGLDGNVRTTTT